MKDSRLRGIIALAVVTIVAFGVIYGSRILVKDENGAPITAARLRRASGSDRCTGSRRNNISQRDNR